MKDTEHELGQVLDEELGQSMIQVPVVRGKPAVLGWWNVPAGFDV